MEESVIVECSRCHTKYRFEGGKDQGEGVWLRCTRCMHVFLYREPGVVEEVKPETPEAALPGMTGHGFPVEEAPAEMPEQSVTEAIGEMKGPASFAEAEETEERQPEISLPEEEAPPEKKSSVMRNVLFIILVLAVAAGVVSILQPEKAKSLVERAVDSIRRVLPFSKAKTVFFTAVEERFLNSPSAGNLMIIRGMAVNNTAEPLPPIRVRARILDQGGKTVREEISLGGNILTDEELGKLSLDELKSILSTPGGRDYPNTLVPPEGTVPFMILISDPPANAVEYTIDTVPAS